LVAIFAARTVLNTGYRIVYPFLPAIARGLDVSLATATGLVSMRLLSGVVAPFIGPVADRQPRRRTMVVAMVVFAAACALLVTGGGLAAGSVMVVLVGTAFALLGISKVVFDPAVHAYMGDSVPYRRRARAVGVVELAWSAAWLFGVPLTGFVMEALGWPAPWIALVALGLAGAAAGVVSDFSFVGVALAPADIALAAHGWFVMMAFRAFLIATLLHTAAVLATAHYPNRYAAVYGVFALLLAAYLWLLFRGPGFGSAQGVMIQVTGQKVIAYAAIVTALIGAWGATRVRERVS